MARSKGGVGSLKRRRNVLAMVKGYRFGRSKKERQAKEAIAHAGKYSFAHRRDKKNDMRHLWTIRISAGLNGALSYSKFIGALKKAKVDLNRKVLSELAADYPKAFAEIVKIAS